MYPARDTGFRFVFDENWMGRPNPSELGRQSLRECYHGPQMCKTALSGLAPPGTLLVAPAGNSMHAYAAVTIKPPLRFDLAPSVPLRTLATY
jgi:hypothetical protein